MKNRNAHARSHGPTNARSGGSSRFVSILATGLGLAWLTLGPAQALEENALLRDKGPLTLSGPPSEPPPSTPVAVGDETVGTLPSLVGGTPIVLVRDAEVVNPSFFVEGRLSDVRNALVSATGETLAQIDVLDPVTERVRLTFPGRTLMAFDRMLVELGDLEFGMWVPNPQPYAYPIGVWAQRFMFFDEPGSRVGLPITPMSSAGALDVAPLVVTAMTATQATDLRVRSTPDLVVFRQVP